MLLSEIGNKEIVDLSTGCSHGELWDAELLFERKSGKINILITACGLSLFFGSALVW